jgi:hypothetical protein
MSNYTKLATEAGDQYLNTLTQVQEQFLKSLSAVTAWTPAPSPMPTPPFVADLPTPREVVDANFAFVAKLLKQQKDFTDKVLSTSAS